MRCNPNNFPSYPNKIPIKTNKFLEITNKISVQTNKFFVTSSYPPYKFPYCLFFSEFHVFLRIIVSQLKQQNHSFFKQHKQNPVKFALTSYNLIYIIRVLIKHKQNLGIRSRSEGIVCFYSNMMKNLLRSAEKMFELLFVCS